MPAAPHRAPTPFRGPIIIFSAKHYRADKQLASEVGANAFLEKPFSPDRLLSLVRDFLARKISVRFWGVRGSIPTASRDTVGYGGNTPCVEVRVSGVEDIFIWDGGTGLRELGRSLRLLGGTIRGYLCFSHFHWDHIQGLPVLRAGLHRGQRPSPWWGRRSRPPISSRSCRGRWPPSTSPWGWSSLAASSFLDEIGEGTVTLGGVQFDTLSVAAPGSGADLSPFARRQAGRLRHGQRAAPADWKTAGGPAAHEMDRFLRFFQGADLLIHDAQYTPEELERQRGWGHSSWPDVLDIAVAAGVKSVQFFHHDPDHSDNFLDEIRETAQQRVAASGGTITCGVAREGDLLVI